MEEDIALFIEFHQVVVSLLEAFQVDDIACLVSSTLSIRVERTISSDPRPI